MSTPPSPTPSAETYPLSAERRGYYEDLYNKLQTAIENASNDDPLESMNDSRLSVAAVISQDNQCHIAADTATFKAMDAQIADANAKLKKLQADIAAVASKTAAIGDVAAAIGKVLSFFPSI